MANGNVKGRGSKMSPRDLLELVERAQKRLEERIDRMHKLDAHLSRQGPKLLARSRFHKSAIIVLGAIIATRVVADSLWGPIGKEPDLEINVWIVLPYTILAVAIAIIGGLDAAFKFGETAAEVNFLKVRGRSVINQVEVSWATTVERLGVTDEALGNTDPLLAMLDEHYTAAETRLSQLSIPLV